MIDVAVIVLALMRLVLFGLSLGLTLISFQAYSQRGGQRLQYAFIGFAFISMGVAVTNLNTQLAAAVTQATTLFQIAETVPFIVGFTMIYLSLYR
ncbi:DUF7521 family protein [Natronomonas sp. EA1]|uniref:DUF7521 family protein n=1 Tax=Natronomonas sp. EA1 TaxID=3421655 RepID=UPI003EBA6CA8